MKNESKDVNLEEEKLLPSTFPELTHTGFGAWSVSKLKSLQNCPLSFYLKYVVKFKVKSPPMDSDRVLTGLGSAAHEILDYVARGLTVDQAYDRVEIESRAYLPPEHWSEIEGNRHSIESFWGKIQEFMIHNKVSKIHPELKLAVTVDWKATKFFASDAYFRGIIDLALELENGDVILIDHKRGPNPAWGGIKNYKFQLNSYLPLFHYGLRPITGGVTGVNFINHGETLLGDYTGLEEVEKTLSKEIHFYTEAAVDGIIEKGGFPHQRNNFCKYCEYKELCKNGNRGTSGELEKYASASRQLMNITEV